MPNEIATPELNLPTDVAVCHGMIRELLTSHHSNQKRIAHLEHQLDQPLKRLHGPRADQVHPDQQLLFDEPAHEPAPAPATLEPTVVIKTVSPGHGRKAIPTNIRRETVVVDIPDAEKLAVGGTWVKIGEEVSEKLDYTPSQLFVRKTVRPKYVVRFENKPDELKMAELPPEAFPK